MRRLLRRPFLLGAALLVLAAAGAAGGYVANRHATPAAGADASSGTGTATPSLEVSATSPPAGDTAVPSDYTLTVVFDLPLAADSPLPTLVPPLPGSWVHDSPTTVQFDSDGSLPPGAQETIEVPSGADGSQSVDGAHLRTPVDVSFTVAPMPELRTQQLLAELGYLPLTFTPDDATPVSPQQAADAQPGAFAWKWPTLPAAFTSLWSAGQPNAVTTGAVMAFEDQHNLETDGVAGPAVWRALLAAAAAGTSNSDPHYDWVDVSTTVPESITVWRDGSSFYSSPANTGIEAAPTTRGTWPVYARYTSTTMSGTNPDGSKYDDPGVPWVSYFHGGDALHGFIRPSYGSPQSLGCVELPPANAAVVYPLTPLGTLVTVE